MASKEATMSSPRDAELVQSILNAVKTYCGAESKQGEELEKPANADSSSMHATTDDVGQKKGEDDQDGKQRVSRKRNSVSSSLYEALDEGAVIGGGGVSGAVIGGGGGKQRDSMSKHLFEYLNDGQQQNDTSLFNYLQQQQQHNNNDNNQLTSHLDNLNDFDEYQRSDGVNIVDFVTEFDRKYQMLHVKGITFSSPALALKLLSKARLSAQEKTLVKKTMDFSRKDGIYEEAKQALIKLSEYEGLRKGFRELQRSKGVQESRGEGKFYLILDSACSSTLCGKKWLDGYLDHIGEDMAADVKYSSSDKMFVFGGGAPVSSLASCRIPAFLAGKMVNITVDVVPNDLPLIFSLGDMKKAEVKLDFTNDTAEIFGQVIKLKTTDSGHYSVPIDGVSFKRRKRFRMLSEEIRMLEELVHGG